MSPDEFVITIISLILAALAWWRLYSPLVHHRNAGRGGSERRLLGLAPLLCAAALLTVLLAWASSDVRNNPIYLIFYTVFGAAVVGALMFLTPLLGLSIRDDAIERCNVAAAYAASGIMLGLTGCYAGANIGDGPGWWVVLFCAMLSSAGFLVLWAIVEGAGHIAETITIERDEGAGLRFGLFAVAVGAILGRSVAGDWVSAQDTLVDFGGFMWPAAALAVIEVIAARSMRRGESGPAGDAGASGVSGEAGGSALPGLAVGLLYIAGALIYLGWLGLWT